MQTWKDIRIFICFQMTTAAVGAASVTIDLVKYRTIIICRDRVCKMSFMRSFLSGVRQRLTAFIIDSSPRNEPGSQGKSIHRKDIYMHSTSKHESRNSRSKRLLILMQMNMRAISVLNKAINLAVSKQVWLDLTMTWTKEKQKMTTLCRSKWLRTKMIKCRRVSALTTIISKLKTSTQHATIIRLRKLLQILKVKRLSPRRRKLVNCNLIVIRRMELVKIRLYRSRQRMLDKIKPMFRSRRS